jgi:hypothetical protein
VKLVTEPFPWEALEALVGAEFRTLDERQRFTIVRMDPGGVEILISSGRRQKILKASLVQAWRDVQHGAELTRQRLDMLQTRRGTYIAAILARLPGIESSSWGEPVMIRRRQAVYGSTGARRKAKGPRPGKPDR